MYTVQQSNLDSTIEEGTCRGQCVSGSYLNDHNGAVNNLSPYL